MKNQLALLAAAGCLILTGVTCARAGSLPLEQITLPPGFSITLYATDVPNARGMVLGANGTLFVGSKQDGRLYAIVDDDGDHRANRVYTIARGLHMPVGVANIKFELFKAEHTVTKLRGSRRATREAPRPARETETA